MTVRPNEIFEAEDRAAAALNTEQAKPNLTPEQRESTTRNYATHLHEHGHNMSQKMPAINCVFCRAAWPETPDLVDQQTARHLQHHHLPVEKFNEDQERKYNLKFFPETKKSEK